MALNSVLTPAHPSKEACLTVHTNLHLTASSNCQVKLQVRRQQEVSGDVVITDHEITILIQGKSYTEAIIFRLLSQQIIVLSSSSS